MPTDVSTSKKPALSRFFDGIERSVLAVLVDAYDEEVVVAE